MNLKIDGLSFSQSTPWEFVSNSLRCATHKISCVKTVTNNVEIWIKIFLDKLVAGELLFSLQCYY